MGGGPANTAKALSSLGKRTYFIGGLSHDEYGRLVVEELSRFGVDLSLSHSSELKTAIATASVDDSGLATYEFNLEDTASFNFHSEWLPTGSPDVLHIGSVATILEPASSALFNWSRELKVPIVFDPNVRPSIEPDRDLYRSIVEKWISIATIVKLSEDDIFWLYGVAEEEVINRWLSNGPRIVIVTRGDKGITAYSQNSVIKVPAVRTTVVDTVGAGDTVGAVVVEGVLEYGLDSLEGEILHNVLTRATRAAAITCSRLGCLPPTTIELMIS